MNTTSLSLLERVRKPQEAAAWERFVELYTPLIYFWGRRAGLQESDADDLVQEVFTALVQKLPDFTYDSGKSFRGWLRAVTFNTWSNIRRRRGPEALNQGMAELSGLAVADSAEEFWEAEYRRHVVGRALGLMQAEFQPATWKACWGLVVGGKPAAQVAAELGLSVGAVYVAKSRVLARLRQELAGLLE